jgi:CrcB protein
MQSYVLVFLGSGLGGVLRHLVNVFVPRALGMSFPYHTLSVNILGSFVMGLVAWYFTLRGDSSQSWRLFLTTGILGGFTTFSAFSLETVLLYQRGEMVLTAAYALLSVGASVAALLLGLQVARFFAAA